MRRGALTLATATLSAVLVTGGLSASPASAAGTTYTMPATGPVTITGHGYGHGHGMSQYGAQGAALAGRTWQQITAFYYPGTTPTATPPRTVRVEITADTTRDVVVAPRSGLSVLRVSDGATLPLPVNGAARWRIAVTTYGNKAAIDFLRDGAWRRWTKFDGDAAFTAGGAPIRLYYAGTSHQFRGSLYASRPSATSTDRDTINRVSLEDYLRGVVPSEMPSSWSPAAVASQAVAARTYAAYQLQVPQGPHYDICDTTSCQVYGGYDREAASSNAAIDATAGMILTYAGKPAFTQFSSSSGGATSAGSTTTPYLAATPDAYDGWTRADGSFGNPNHNWSVAVDVATIEAAWGISDLKSITVTDRDGNGDWGGRVRKLTLNGAVQHVDVYGDTFRSRLGLKSTYFTIAGVAARTS
jgi:SpoIID/LytB domain protein